MVGENVLICDDERLFALDLEKRVESLGYNVCAIAANGEDAVELARKVGPQLALMDIRLNGGLTGIETAQILHDELKIPSIFVSAYSDKETLRQALQPQPLGFLVKPVVDRDLKIAMEVGFSSQQAHQNLEQEVRRYREFFSQSSGSGYVPFHADINTYLAHEAR
ncbi:MAG: hypothetical protein DCC75_07655, partial [Proteobacteria bacterium]